MKIAILLKLVLFFFFFAFSLPFSQHFKFLLLLPSKFISYLKPSYLATLFAFNFILIAILMASFFNKSSSSGDLDPISYLPLQEQYQVVDEAEITRLDEDDHRIKNNDSSVPRSLYVEQLVEKKGIHEIYETSDDEDHGDDGYDEDNEYNDEDGSEDDVESEDEIKEGDLDMDRRIEEFIAKNNKIWKEEKLIEKVFYMARDEFAYTFMQV